MNITTRACTVAGLVAAATGLSVVSAHATNVVDSIVKRPPVSLPDVASELTGLDTGGLAGTAQELVATPDKLTDRVAHAPGLAEASGLTQSSALPKAPLGHGPAQTHGTGHVPMHKPGQAVEGLDTEKPDWFGADWFGQMDAESTTVNLSK